MTTHGHIAVADSNFPQTRSAGQEATTTAYLLIDPDQAEGGTPAAAYVPSRHEIIVSRNKEVHRLQMKYCPVALCTLKLYPMYCQSKFVWM